MQTSAEENNSKILVVDDDKNIVESLRRIITFISPTTYVRTALGGQEGVKALLEERFDLVISDLRMPQIDGSAMLSSARRFNPQTIRVLLSGQGTVEKLLEALPVSHQYLEKPCPPYKLKNIIDIVNAVKESSLPSILIKHILSFSAFPCDPVVLNVLHSILELEDTSLIIDRLTKIIPSFEIWLSLQK